MDSLVSFQWLSDHLDDPDLVVIDCTNSADWSTSQQKFVTVSGYNQWAGGHIDQSRHADFTDGFSGDASRFRNTLPEPHIFATAMARLGVTASSHVVLYDTAQSMWAARVWWMLKWIGFDTAGILDGGWQNWVANGGRVSGEPALHRVGVLDCTLKPHVFICKEALWSALEDENVLLIDALSEAQFSGAESDLGLSGHIPGAINIPGTSLLDTFSGCYLPLDQIAARLPEDRDTRTIIYCGSGIAAASVGFVMHRLGFEDVSIYMPGLQEWLLDESALTERG